MPIIGLLIPDNGLKLPEGRFPIFDILRTKIFLLGKNAFLIRIIGLFDFPGPGQIVYQWLPAARLRIECHSDTDYSYYLFAGLVPLLLSQNQLRTVNQFPD